MPVLYPGGLEFGVMVFVEGGKPENREKNPWSKTTTYNKLNPNMAPGRYRTQATLHCASALEPLRLAVGGSTSIREWTVGN